jgi:hypothetical protein
LINSLAQLPKNLSSYAENRLNLLPTGTTNLINKITPEDTSSAINQLFGEPKYPGEAALRGGIKNIPQIAGGLGIANFLNPMRYRSSNIARNVSNVQDINVSRYSNAYNDIFNEAKQNNLGSTLPKIINKLNLRTAFKNEPADALVSRNEFLSNPNPRTAHDMKSDLLKIQRKLTRMQQNEVLSKGNRNKLNSVNDAIDKIEKNMFTGRNGAVNRDLANKYRKTQEGYEKEVLPYTLHTPLQKYREGKLRHQELIPTLKKDEFAAMRGESHHPELFTKDKIRNALIGLAIAGAGTSGARSIFDYIYGK